MWPSPSPTCPYFYRETVLAHWGLKYKCHLGSCVLQPCGFSFPSYLAKGLWVPLEEMPGNQPGDYMPCCAVTGSISWAKDCDFPLLFFFDYLEYRTPLLAAHPFHSRNTKFYSISGDSLLVCPSIPTRGTWGPAGSLSPESLPSINHVTPSP